MNKEKTAEKIISLDEGVIRALEFFKAGRLPRLDLKKIVFPIVVGSGNAYHTARILFSNQAAIISDESGFKNDLIKYRGLIKKGDIKTAIVISASGEKDSIWELELAKKNKLRTVLLTCSPDSSAARLADQVIIYPSIPEPYTYNISTYLGMILSLSWENPDFILNFLKRLKLKSGFDSYSAYSFIWPDRFSALVPMIDIKKSELFGPKLSLRAFSRGQARHAKFVIRDRRELVINCGEEKNSCFGYPQSRWQIDLPDQAGFAFVLCLAYYLVGRIQTAKPDYFKNNIKQYCQDYGPKAYGLDRPFSLFV